MDKQEAFNKVWQHFVVEKQPPGRSVTDVYGSCSYCTPEGHRCAIGALVTEEEAKEMARATVGSIRHMTPDIWEKYMPKSIRSLDKQFLVELQDAHDSPGCGSFHLNFETSLRCIADNFTLQVPA